MEIGNLAIRSRAGFMARHMERHNVLSVTITILYDLRVPVNCDGFKYLKLGIPIAYRNKSQLVASEIYEAVAECYSPKACAQNIGPAIHEVIEKAWNARIDDRWSWYLPDYLMERETPPTNLEFFGAIINFIDFWQDCYEKEAVYE